MKSVAALSAFAGFLGALALLSLGDTRQSVRQLRGGLDRSELRIAEARTEVYRLRRAPVAAETPRPPRDPARLQHDILGPSVQVNVQGSVGGGTLLFSRDA